MDYKIISTGSQGNAVLIQNTILIDCGVPFSRLADDYKSLKLVLLTHIHGDHFNPATLRKLARERPTLRFACCVWLCAALVDAGVKASQIDVISTERWYIYSGLCRIKAQETKHDVQNCCWRIELPSTPVERLFNISKALGICTTVEEFKTWFSENVVLYKILATPIETTLTPAEIAAYKALTAYAPDTVVQASDGAGIKLGYQRDVNLVVKNLEDAIASMTAT